jgi:hypothetical protein
MDLGATCDSATGGVLLTWTATGDDGNYGVARSYDIRYAVSAITEGNFYSAQQLPNPPAPAPAGIAEEWSVDLPGVDGSYYFAIKVFDEESNGSDLSGSTQFSPGTIRSPTPDTVYVDEGNRIVTLIVRATQSCIDAHYQFQLDTVQSFGTARTVTDTEPDTYARAAYTGLLDNTVYYWRCRAVAADGSQTSSYTSTRAFMPFVDLVSGCDDLILESPTDGSTVDNRRPTLVVANMNEEAGNVYFFELDDEASFGDLIATGVVNQQDGNSTTWTVPSDLDPGSLYFWRVRANACEYSDTYTFALSPAESSIPVGSYAYPNPYNPSDGAPVTFADLPPSSNLTVMTVSGSVVRYWEDVTGEVAWNGTNQQGTRVASGVYMWFVDPSGESGKLIILH